MKVWVTILLLGCCLAIPLTSMAEEMTHAHSIHNPAIEHVEITLPKGLLSGFPVYDQALGMEEAVAIGLQHNLDIQVAQSQTDVNHADLFTAKARRWPSVTAGSLSYITGGDSLFLRTPGLFSRVVDDDSTFSQEFSLYSTMPLFTGGKIRSGIRATRFALERSEAALDQAAIDTAYQIRQTYLNALLSQSEHHIHQKHVDVQRELLRIAKVKYREGKGLKADVLRVQAEIADAEKMINDQHIRLNETMFDLKVAMGIDLGSDIQLSDTLSKTPWQGDELQGLVQNAMSTNPKVVQSKKQMDEAKAKLRLARSQYLPQVYGHVSGNARLPDNPPALGNGVVGMVTASLPVFDLPRQGTIKKAKAALQKAEKAYKASQLTTTRDIAQAWTDLEFAANNITLAKPALTQAKEDLRLTQKRFQVGRAIQVEVQDAILTLLQAQLNYAQAMYAHEVAKAKLKQAIGKM